MLDNLWVYFHNDFRFVSFLLLIASRTANKAYITTLISRATEMSLYQEFT